MDAIGHGVMEALRLIFSGDAEIFEIVGLSLYVSFFSVVISSCIGIPAGVFLGTHSFRGKGNSDPRDLYSDEPASRHRRSYGIFDPYAERTAGQLSA